MAVQFRVEWTVTPFGPVVVAWTRPLPATTEVPMVPLPLDDRATVHPLPLLPVTTVALLPPELPTLTELLTCA